MTTTTAAVLCAVLAVPAASDVTVRYKAASGGMGGIGAFESSGERSFAGLKSREESNTRFTGAVLGLMSGRKGKDSAHILRVDLDKRWALNLKKKTYRESPIALAPMEAPEGEDAKPGKDGGSRPQERKPTHRIKSAKVEVKRLGDKKEINGFPCSGYLGTVRVVVEELESKKTAEFKLLSELWTTPWTKDLRQAVKEESAFHKAYLAKLGEKLGPQDQQRFGLDSAKMLLGAGGPEVSSALSKLKSELDKIEGYPIVTESSGHSPASEEAAKASAATKDDEEGSMLSDAASANPVAGILGGMAKRAARKKAKEKLAPKPGAPAYSVRHEVLSVEVAALDQDAFEIPAGFKKKD